MKLVSKSPHHSQLHEHQANQFLFFILSFTNQKWDNKGGHRWLRMLSHLNEEAESSDDTCTRNLMGIYKERRIFDSNSNVLFHQNKKQKEKKREQSASRIIFLLERSI